jgi:protocatechuate 3,4-dioxygenase beta subunit
VVLASGTVVKGRVLDAEGRAVPGAFVRLRIQLPSRGPFPSSRRRRTTTDAQGRYRFERLLPVGTGTLDAGTQDAWTPPASAGSADPGFDLEREGPVIERDLVLAAIPRVRGLVVDAEGRPVAGALVGAEGSDWRGPAGAVRAPPRDISGGDGGFALAGMAPGETWTLEARTATLRSEPLPALRIPHPPEPAPEVRLVLRPTTSLRGRVSRPDGSALAGTQVVLNPADSARRGSLTANTDEEGRFVFDGLRAGRYQLPAQRWDGEEGSAPQRFELAWGQVVEGVTVVREPARTITGIVVGSQDESVPRAVVEFQRQGSTGHRSRGVDTARADGRFELHVAPGTYDLWVRGGDTPITVEAGATDITLRTTVPPVREVFGAVVDDAGRPVPRAKVTLWVHEGTSLSGRGAACTMGRFHASLETAMSTADVVVEDARDAAGRPLNLQPGAWHGVSLDGGEELRCRLEPGLVVLGRVVDAAGRGVSNVSIRCRLAGHDTSWLGGLGEHVALPRVRTDDTGRFAFIGLGSEPLQLTVEPTSPWIPPPPTQVVPGVAGPLEIRLERGHALGGHVRGDDGRPVVGARVRVRWAADEPDGDGVREADGRTDEAGRFRLPRVGSGPLTVAVEGVWSEPWPYRPFVAEGVEPDTLDLDLRLERGGDLTGVVVDPEGNPVRSGSVSIWRRREGRAPTHHVVGVDERGRFVVPELEPGIYELVGSGGSEFAPTERTVVHAPAQDVRLVLGRTWLLHGTVVGRPDVTKQVHFLYHEDGEPKLEGIGYGDGGPFSFRVRTDRPGTLLLTIEETGEYALLENVRPGSGPHRLVPAPGAAIEGRIDGGPVDAGEHQVSGIDARCIRIRTRTEADGTFRFTGVPPGAYRLEAWVPREGQYLQYVAERVEAGAKDVVLHRVP